MTPIQRALRGRGGGGERGRKNKSLLQESSNLLLAAEAGVHVPADGAEDHDSEEPGVPEEAQEPARTSTKSACTRRRNALPRRRRAPMGGWARSRKCTSEP